MDRRGEVGGGKETSVGAWCNVEEKLMPKATRWGKVSSLSHFTG